MHIKFLESTDERYATENNFTLFSCEWLDRYTVHFGEHHILLCSSSSLHGELEINTKYLTQNMRLICSRLFHSILLDNVVNEQLKESTISETDSKFSVAYQSSSIFLPTFSTSFRIHWIWGCKVVFLFCIETEFWNWKLSQNFWNRIQSDTVMQNSNSSVKCSKNEIPWLRFTPRTPSLISSMLIT